MIKKSNLATIIFFIFSFEVFSQEKNDFNCEKDLDFIYEKLVESSSYKTQKDKHKTIGQQYKSIKQDVSHAKTSVYNCFKKLNSFIHILNDSHNEIYGNNKRFSYKELTEPDFLHKYKNTKASKYFPKSNWDLKNLEQELTLKPFNELEGIYYYKDYFKIGIKKSKTHYQGVILETKIPSWEKGETILELFPIKNNRYKVITGTFVDKTLIAGVDKLENGQLRMFSWKKANNKADYSQVNSPDKTFLIKELPNQILYLKLGSFNSSKQGIKEAKNFYKKIKKHLNKENIIIDLRNNPGGGDKSSKQFLKLLTKVKGTLYVLMNFKTMSNAEQFIIKLKDSKNIKLLGSTTHGKIAYGKNYPTSYETPSKHFKIHFTDMNFIQFIEFENKGIKPDIYLDPKQDWIQQAIKIINTRVQK